MEAAVRSVPRASTAFRSVAVRRSAAGGRRRVFQQQQRSRPFSSASVTPTARHVATGTLLSSFFVFGSAGLYALLSNSRPTLAKSPLPDSPQPSKPALSKHGEVTFSPTRSDYQKVYNAIAQKFLDEDDYDDGSYAPVVLRLGWHSSGSYDAATHTGGSNGATMRFPPEGDLPANSGLRHARDFLESVKDKFPWISYSDLWTLAAVCAVQEMSGPTIPWRPGRRDKDVADCAPDGRLPDGSQGPDHVRRIFGRMGFSDREMVALVGAHAVGRCHPDRSGWEGPWTFSPITFTNEFYRLLLEEDWRERRWDGPAQMQDQGSKTLMMLPTDYCLLEDGGFRPWVEKYADDQELFFEDFSQAMVKLFELGVPFGEGGEGERIAFDRTE